MKTKIVSLVAASMAAIVLFAVGYMVGARRVAGDCLQGAYLQNALIAVAMGDARSPEEEKKLKAIHAEVALRNLGELAAIRWSEVTYAATVIPGIGDYDEHMAKVAGYLVRHPELSVPAEARARILVYLKKKNV
jgi:hypothetical protein